MKSVLVACEFSGVVRDAFKAKGWDAWSCDLIPSEAGGKHLICDARIAVKMDWDIIIAHPPCTYLCSSGLHWNKRRPGRQELTDQALEFVEVLMDAPCDFIAIENPIGCISTKIRPPDQIIQPYQFGHPESKATCLWLKNLPRLVPTNILKKPELGRWDNQTPSGQSKLGPSKDRAKIRSRTYQGIADCMAQTWTTCLGA